MQVQVLEQDSLMPLKVPLVVGGGSNKHKTAPTSGLDWTTHRQIVTDGFRVNDFIVTIDDNWWTDFPEKQIIVGKKNNDANIT